MVLPNTSDYLLAAGAPDDPAVIDGGHTYTYRRLRGTAARLAARLADLGLPPGSRVGILAANSFFWVAAYLAAMKSNIAVPLSDKSNEQDIARQIAWVECAAVFVDEPSRRRFAAALDPVATIADDVLDPSDDSRWLESEPVDPDTDAVLMFTSGTTAGPKAVRLTHRNLQANTDSIISYLALRRDDRVLVILPFFYCYGASLLHTHLRVGASMVISNNVAFPEVALDLIEGERCTGLAGVPSSFQLLLRASTFAGRPLPSLRLIQQAGGRLPVPLVEELRAAKPGVRLFLMYGQTEATARLSYLPPEQLPTRASSIGRGIPGVELRVVDESGDPIRAGETGEIVAYGESISPGYYKDPGESAKKFREGALWTGDLATVDAEGYIYIVDRRSDFIKSWGHRISSAEIEACALRLAEVESAAAVGVPDPRAGEAVALFATVRPGASVTADDVLAVTRANLPRHMVPRSVHVIDAMPLTPSGKIAKTKLRESLR